jgi:hypothetical protein
VNVTTEEHGIDKLECSTANARNIIELVTSTGVPRGTRLAIHVTGAL